MGIGREGRHGFWKVGRACGASLGGGAGIGCGAQNGTLARARHVQMWVLPPMPPYSPSAQSCAPSTDSEVSNSTVIDHSERRRRIIDTVPRRSQPIRSESQ
jgi:hypothetical protein